MQINLILPHDLETRMKDLASEARLDLSEYAIHLLRAELEQESPQTCSCIARSLGRRTCRTQALSTEPRTVVTCGFITNRQFTIAVDRLLGDDQMGSC